MKRALVFIATSVLLSGCAMIDRMGSGTPNCTGSTCTVTVTVKACKDIDIDPVDVHVNSGAKHIEWNLAGGSQWEFVTDGVTFKGNTENEFEGKDKQARKFKWKYKNTLKPRRHYYAVTVTDGRQVCTKDPSIMNN